MTTFAPRGWHSVTPRLIVRDPAKLIDFLRQTFGAVGEFLPGAPTQMKIGDSIVMISGAEVRDPISSFLYVYIEDADVTYRRAIAAGATSIEEPRDMPYGDRRAMIKDPFGNYWQIATYRNPM
jgi:PhnB protein